MPVDDYIAFKHNSQVIMKFHSFLMWMTWKNNANVCKGTSAHAHRSSPENFNGTDKKFKQKHQKQNKKFQKKQLIDPDSTIAKECQGNFTIELQTKIREKIRKKKTGWRNSKIMKEKKTKQEAKSASAVFCLFFFPLVTCYLKLPPRGIGSIDLSSADSGGIF